MSLSSYFYTARAAFKIQVAIIGTKKDTVCLKLSLATD